MTWEVTDIDGTVSVSRKGAGLEKMVPYNWYVLEVKVMRSTSRLFRGCLPNTQTGKNEEEKKVVKQDQVAKVLEEKCLSVLPSWKTALMALTVCNHMCPSGKQI